MELSEEDKERFRQRWAAFQECAARVRGLHEELKAARIDLAVIEEAGVNPTTVNGEGPAPLEDWNIVAIQRTTTALHRVANIHKRLGVLMSDWATLLDQTGSLGMELRDKLMPFG